MSEGDEPRVPRMPMTAREARLPTGKVVTLAHSAVAGVTAVQIEVEANPPIHRVFWRPSHETTYHQLDEVDATVSWDCLTGADLGYFFVLLRRWHPLQSRGFGANAVGVLRLEFGERMFLQSTSVRLPAEAIASQLLRSSDSGGTVDMVALVRSPDSERTRVRRVVARVNVASGTFVELDELPGVHF